MESLREREEEEEEEEDRKGGRRSILTAEHTHCNVRSQRSFLLVGWRSAIAPPKHTSAVT